MTEIHPDARKLLESDALVHFATLNPDGGPQVTMIWIGLDGDEIVSAHLFANQKVKNVQRDPRVSLSVEGTGTADNGLRRYLWIRGQARVQEGGAPELLQHLAHTYLGPEVVFPPMDDPPPGFVIRTKPERIGGVGPWAE
ncbi:MAG: PPOX class F420-dependent oxidoreductase [Solirubrobacterales bacterium]